MDISLTTENFASDDQSWLGSAHGTDAARTVTLDTSAFTAGTHYPDGYFKSGIPLGKITATGKYGPYNDAAADGSEVLAGFLFCAVDIPSVTTTDIGAAMLVHGVVIESKLPVAVNAAGKADVAGRIIFA
jgi:hypothetical protein